MGKYCEFCNTKARKCEMTEKECFEFPLLLGPWPLNDMCNPILASQANLSCHRYRNRQREILNMKPPKLEVWYDPTIDYDKMEFDV